MESAEPTAGLVFFCLGRTAVRVRAAASERPRKEEGDDDVLDGCLPACLPACRLRYATPPPFDVSGGDDDGDFLALKAEARGRESE